MSNKSSDPTFHTRIAWSAQRLGLLLAVIILVPATVDASMVGGARKTLAGHVPRVLSQLSLEGNLPETNRLNLAIGLALRDEKGLDDFLKQVYDPGSPDYHRYLTPEQFTEKFGPTEAEYEAVIAFASRNNMTVTARHGNRLLLDVNASVADIQKAFQITLHTYRHPTEARSFFAPDTEPTVDAGLKVADISGLNNYILPRPKSLKSGVAAASPRSGSASGGAYIGNDFRAAYFPGLALTGTGQAVGLLEFDGFYSSDISSYETATGVSPVPLRTVLLDGFNGEPTTGPYSGDSEVSLDIEMAISMAPGLKELIVFEAGPNGLQNDVLNAMVASNTVRQFSCSWGWGGGPSTTTDNIFKQMASQGQSFFVASGDTDAYTAGQVDDPNQTFAPSSCPFITIVGGTTLSTSSKGGPWAGETVWNSGGGEGSSGGISSYYKIPTWQAGIDMGANGGSATYRNIPDVALVADNVFVHYGNGRKGAFNGTSCATPLWAGIAALLNQQAASKGLSPVGFLNPALYALGKGANYASVFHDITTGDNTWSDSPNSFYAAQGYDLCTGWGTPAGKSFIDSLSGPPEPLGISSSVGFTANGPVGGPFGPTSSNLLLTNSGTTSLMWSVLNTPSWLSAQPSQGSLAPGATTSVAVSLTGSEDGLSAGVYTANVVFTNWNTHVAQNVAFKLQVGQSLVENGGFETGDFTGWTLVGNTSADGNLYNGVQSSTDDPSVVHSGNYGVFLGDTQLATLSQSLATVPGQSYLLSFWLNNTTNGAGQRFLVNWIVNVGSTNTLYDISNPPVLPWTNFQFIVVAASANSIIQFGAENPPNGFGLDDIGVTPIPTAVFQSIAETAGGFSMTWQTANNLTYQVQYKTNMFQSVWINLGPPLVATNQAITISDPNVSSEVGSRFYRLVVQP